MTTLWSSPSFSFKRYVTIMSDYNIKRRGRIDLPFNEFDETVEIELYEVTHKIKVVHTVKETINITQLLCRRERGDHVKVILNSPVSPVRD